MANNLYAWQGADGFGVNQSDDLEIIGGRQGRPNSAKSRQPLSLGSFAPPTNIAVSREPAGLIERAKEGNKASDRDSGVVIILCNPNTVLI